MYKKDDVMQQHTHASKITTNIQVNIDLPYPNLRVTKLVTWTCREDNSSKSRYVMILVRDLLTELGLNV